MQIVGSALAQRWVTLVLQIMQLFVAIISHYTISIILNVFVEGIYWYNGFMEKTCTRCKITKTLDQFHKEVRGKFGVKSKCNKCITELSQQWKKENPERERANRKRWNATNKTQHHEMTYNWRDANKQRHAEYVAKYQRDRKAVDPLFKLTCQFRSLLYNHLMRKNLKKHQRVERYLGCSFEDFKKHIESQFVSGMTWENYGTYWSIDHCCPCYQAQNEEEFDKLQHFSNLRPVTVVKNLFKSNKKTKEAESLCVKLLGRSWI